MHLYNLYISYTCCMDIMSCCIPNPVLFNQKKVSQWFVIILILLSNDIHVNPGPYCENNLKFMNWNVNSLAKDNF